MEMAKWIGDVKAAELAEDSYDENGTEDLVAADRASTWKPMTLAVLFGGQKEHPHDCCLKRLMLSLHSCRLWLT